MSFLQLYIPVRLDLSPSAGGYVSIIDTSPLYSGDIEMPTSVNTAKVTDRRQLQFNGIDDVLAEIDRIVAADQAGTMRQLGNWTPGQNLGHVAAWINYSYDGFPLKPPPWFIRIILRNLVKKYLRKGMPNGVRIPGAENGTYGTDSMTTADGAEKLRLALRRLQSDEPAKYDSPGFGAMSHPDRIRLNLRHAELHLSFLRY
jgi:hypothetical protein